ncbi:hypothetical protein KXQ82_13960 [Mucilaginibacter sp. HMF5004]|uniref:hypothetical protein n=1 Tax=Mucilaginibacter rivuli TaxID=2857527 RepID=UPI001C5EACCA|nr:hypothetical protein [Mucilaginibacter rivuli]MBW4890832.1 hypothetical protein [Mucilaginibacter rivuli]
MPLMILSNDQLETIRVYVAQDCKYPDLQLEIIEHIKYPIQDMMTADDRLALEDAYIMVRMEFGDNSFKIFEESKKASLVNKYRNMFLKTLMAQLNLKYAVACTTIVLWLYLFYTEVRLPEIPGTFSGAIFQGFLPFVPIYLITMTMRFGQARKYKNYYTLAMSNIVLFKWIYLEMFAYLLWFATQILAGEGKFATASVTGSIAIMLTIVFFRAGYVVRSAAIADCRDMEPDFKLATA